ncbi:sulfotransferase domain-containing protein [Marilutibacter alkalisoli]|nr:sulfotransferase domain-containing protein [Lysobacter alkalisoli]
MSIRKPNFMIIGAQKCGTTYLCAALSRHPQVFHSDPKELLFFQRKDVSAETFDDYLSNNFTAAGDQPLVGEGSTVYFQWPNALPNIKKYLGTDLKMIVCLRHPTDRAVSFYLHNYRKKRLTGAEVLTHSLGDVRVSPVTSSLYAKHIERWLEEYGDNMHFMLFDTLVESPTAFVGEACDYLGIPNVCQLRDKPVNRGFELCWDGDSLVAMNEQGERLEGVGFSRQELEDLHASFSDDVEQTERLIGRSLATWKQLPTFLDKQKNW